jgi:uncharacterized protein (TIGR02001 family)
VGKLNTHSHRNASQNKGPGEFAGWDEGSNKQLRKIAMHKSVRSLLVATVFAGAAFAATPAMAQEEESSGVSISGNVTMVSDYRFRGIGLSDGDPAIQGGITLSTEPGLYVGAWGSSLGFTPTYGEMELDLYAGFSTDIAEGVGIDVGGTYYLYPSNNVGPADYVEFYAKVTPSVGPVGLTLGAFYSPKQDSLGDTDNLYFSVDASLSVPSTPLTLTAHAGYTDGFLTYTADGTAFDYSVGASVTVLGGLSLGVAYVGVEGPVTDGITDDTIVGTLGFSF